MTASARWLWTLPLAAVLAGAAPALRAAPEGPPHRPPPVRGERHPEQRWWDNAHGHGHYYPAPGWSVRTLPPRSRVVVWAGVNYHFNDGVWYSHGPHGYLVVRPPLGIVVDDLPLFRTVVTIGALTYYYANGVYYRPYATGGYEVVAAPVEPAAGGAPAPAAPSSDKLYIYPRQGQSAQQQASDEYECHRWAVTQTGFDPTAAAVGQNAGDTGRRSDYQRARGACLEGRGYTVR